MSVGRGWGGGAWPAELVPSLSGAPRSLPADNAINGVPTCASDWLLQDVARDAWGFDGYITSDCGAEADVLYNHHFTATGEEAVKAILHAGTDSDCGSFFAKSGGVHLGVSRPLPPLRWLLAVRGAWLALMRWCGSLRWSPPARPLGIFIGTASPRSTRG